MRLWLALVAGICACRHDAQPLYPAGSEKDEGHGILAQASTQFMTDEDADALPSNINAARRYGGNAYGNSEYGGSTYAGYTVPAWPATAPSRVPKYNQVQGLTGAIEGTITLRTSKLSTTSCPTVDAPRVALVYIETVKIGRALMNEGRPASVGGTLVKRGCSLAPLVQIVTPLPAALSIHGDAKPAKLRIAAKLYDLQPAGRVAIPLAAGTTRVDIEDAGAAWIVALDTPYYAITDDHGRFRIDELAAGTYEVTIWQPPTGRVINNTISYGEPVITKRTVKVENRRATRLDVR